MGANGDAEYGTIGSPPDFLCRSGNNLTSAREHFPFDLATTPGVLDASAPVENPIASGRSSPLR